MSAIRLTPDTLGEYQAALRDTGVDGWLFYDFRGTNPVAGALLGVGGHVTRRFFVWVPVTGVPVAVTHAIEQGVWRAWPASWGKVVYSSWRSLESHVAALVGGRRIAMEYSAGGAVPYLDRIPAGMLELIRSSGAVVVSSGNLVSRFYACWSAADLASHRRAAELTQDVFVRAWSKLGTFRGDAKFSTWLHRLAVNLILSRRASWATERARFLDGEDTLEGLAARPSGRELGLDFEKAIDLLPDGARTVFVLHDVEGWKHDEIARTMGVTSGTTKAQLHRARMLLRRVLA
ncbi:MAG: RNA polymerase sigma factor [Gemmatimonadaceae bacterium]|nr:RNA polymerase sigma factor [Gemmatimonadaceae bacterium]